MRICLVVALTLAFTALAGADDPTPLEDGMYWLTRETPVAEVPNHKGEMVKLGGRFSPTIQKATVVSVSNRNDAYTVRVDCSYDEQAKSRRHVFVVDGVASRSSGGGGGGEVSLHRWFRIEGREQGLAVAKHFGVKALERHHPGHQAIVEFAQVGDWKGDSPREVELSIENIGTTPFAFVQGGRNRGARDSQFSFVAINGSLRDGGLKDIGDPTNFGGRSVARVLKPGEVHRQRVDLRKWFDMPKGRYNVIGTYEMRYTDPSDRNDQTQIWHGYVSAQCVVTVPAP